MNTCTNEQVRTPPLVIMAHVEDAFFFLYNVVTLAVGHWLLYLLHLQLCTSFQHGSSGTCSLHRARPFLASSPGPTQILSRSRGEKQSSSYNLVPY